MQNMFTLHLIKIILNNNKNKNNNNNNNNSIKINK